MMSIWKDQPSAARKESALPPSPEPVRGPPTAVPAATVLEPAASLPSRTAAKEPAAKESLIAADLTIEGKIEGSGHVRIAGKFKGDVNVQGDLTIESNAKLSGGVKASRVVIAGELEGNIESAKVVELQASGVLTGDVKAGSMTVAAGARMRGQADFGWSDKDSSKA